MEPLRIGVLGAARIADLAIVKPARATGARLVSIAARDPRRAAAFAAEHGVERVAASYEELLADPQVEAVYNPLPNALHGPWNLAAIRAGKHVLSEKPFAADTAEAIVVRDAGHRAALVVADGFHYLYHPVMHRLRALASNGEIGELRRIEATVAMPDPGADDPRWSLDLAGGALMDLGCYALHVQRLFGDPVVVGAKAGEHSPQVDEWLDAELEFPSGVTGSARCHMAADRWEMTCTLIGSKGTATAMNFVQPHLDDRVVTPAGTEHLGTRSSYIHQLEAFTAAVRQGTPMPTDSDDAVATMRLIDDCYRAAGLTPRPARLR